MGKIPHLLMGRAAVTVVGGGDIGKGIIEVVFVISLRIIIDL